MYMLKKITALALSLAITFTFSVSAIAIDTNPPSVDPLENAVFETFGNIESGNYTEVATLTNGEQIIYEHSITSTGNEKTIVYEPGGIRNVVEFNPQTQDLFYNGALVARTEASNNAPNARKSGNWSNGEYFVYNYLTENFTKASLVGALATFMEAPVSTVAAIIAGAFYTATWISCGRTYYLNYVDYAPKVGGYYHSVVYDGRNATGSVLGQYTSTIFKR